MVTVILQNPKYLHNIAGALRACAVFEADRLRWSGARVNWSEGQRLPREERMKGYAVVDQRPHQRPFDELARGTRTVCVELTPSAMALTDYSHPRGDSAYVFGPEDGSVSGAWRALCHEFVYIPGLHCLNLAAAVNVVLAHRFMQRGLRTNPAAVEGRGYGEIDVAGWEGR